MMGKKNKVVVLLTPNMKRGLECLNKNRRAYEVKEDNPYVFANGNEIVHS